MAPDILTPMSLSFSPSALIKAGNNEDQNVCKAQNKGKVMVTENRLAI